MLISRRRHRKPITSVEFHQYVIIIVQDQKLKISAGKMTMGFFQVERFLITLNIMIQK